MNFVNFYFFIKIKRNESNKRDRVFFSHINTQIRCVANTHSDLLCVFVLFYFICFFYFYFSLLNIICFFLHLIDLVICFLRSDCVILFVCVCELTVCVCVQCSNAHLWIWLWLFRCSFLSFVSIYYYMSSFCCSFD